MIKSAICNRMRLTPEGRSKMLQDDVGAPEVPGLDESMVDRLNREEVNPSVLGRPYVAYTKELNNVATWSYTQLIFYGVMFPGEDQAWTYAFAVRCDDDPEVCYEQRQFEMQCRVGGVNCRLCPIDVDCSTIADLGEMPEGRAETVLFEYSRKIEDAVDWSVGDQRRFTLILKIGEDVQGIMSRYSLSFEERTAVFDSDE
eukprot:1724247-Amphidinium_carterae.1